MKCPKCGCEMGEGSLFCGQCGNKLPQVKRCPKCNAPVSDDDIFCGECGAPLKDTNTAPEVNNEPVYEYDESEDNGKRKKIIMAIVAVIVIVGVIAFFVHRNRMQANNSGSDSIASDSIETVEELSAQDILKQHPNMKVFETLKGDFDGDGNEETLYAIVSDVDEESYDLDSSAANSNVKLDEYFCFSKKSIPDFDLGSDNYSVPSWTKPENIGDLDGDGADEIGYYQTGAINGSWSGYCVVSLQKGKWVKPIKPIGLNCDAIYDESENRNSYVPVRKASKAGYVEIDDEQDWYLPEEDSIPCEHNDKFKFVKKIVKFNKNGIKK